ncbi:MAG: iron-containing alcohol dehydrogenase [Bradymonadales bacterium]|nr:iron-containing alcohol dehydrogenase [Bradymonadales bacterium]
MQTKFNYPTRIRFGQGVIDDLVSELTPFGVKRPLLVTDRGLMHTPIPERVIDILKKGALCPALFDQVDPNPTDEQVDLGAQAFRDHQADGLVALGGGSPLDAAKAIQVRIHHGDPMESYDDLLGGDAKITGEMPPLVAIPTTSGTGSEVSRSAVITVAAAGRKVVIFSPRMMPSVALCDPELTYGLPPRITAETGMDALSHNLEAYLATGYHPMADAIALKAIGMVATWLPVAVRDGREVTARQEMMMASTMGAVAFQKGLGVIHSLAHPLSSVAGLSHGLANAIMMPYALRFNGAVATDRMAEVAVALQSAQPTAEGAARAVEKLLEAIGLPTRLSQVGVVEQQLELLVEKALADGCYHSNPRPCGAKDMEGLYRAAL